MHGYVKLRSKLALAALLVIQLNDKILWIEKVLQFRLKTKEPYCITNLPSLFISRSLLYTRIPISTMTESSEKFSLKWNDFKENTAGAFQQLRNEPDFADVTLACEDDQHIEAHRIILTASSPFFRTVLKRNKHSHPLIYMRGLKAKDLTAIVDFIYYGEANVYQEDLDGFLSLAEELQLKGLTSTQNENLDKKEEPSTILKLPKPSTIQSLKQDPKLYTSKNIEMINEPFKQNKTDGLEVNWVVPFDTGLIKLPQDITTEDLEAKKMCMIEKVDDAINKWRCTVCGKTTKNRSGLTDMKRHTETHSEGAAYPCNQCGKSSRSSNALQSHVSAYHRK